MGLSDHARILATISIADDEATADRLLQALKRLTHTASEFEDVKVRDAIGRIAAEQITPYPPGVPVVVPGERINQAVIDYLLTGLEAGMVLPDPADPSLNTIRVMK
jgi:arginine decarboxylase